MPVATAYVMYCKYYLIYLHSLQKQQQQKTVQQQQQNRSRLWR